MTEHTPAGHGSIKSYTIGFVLSLVLTFEAFLVVQGNTFSGWGLTLIILLLAITQLLVQLFFFLHLDRAVRAPWNIIMFLFMAMVVTMIVLGSLWIMQNLDYQMKHPSMTPDKTEKYLRDEERL